MPSFSFSYEYDRAGNRSKKIDNLTSEVTTYVYDSANQLISMEGPDGTTTFDWDAAGNMIAKHAPEGTTTYTWDYRNRLTQVAPPVGDPINFAYNAMGQRIQKNGTRFIYDGVQLLQETDLNNQTLRSNTFTNEGYGDLVSENDGTDSSFPTFNGQSSTDAIVDNTATVTDRFSYSAFGGEDSHTGSSTTPFRFVGKQSYYSDAETGLYLLGAGGNPNGAGRYYDPELGRFISRDPVGLVGGDVNLYRYARNNPINRVDPFGTICQEIEPPWYDLGDWPLELGSPIELNQDLISPPSIVIGYDIDVADRTMQGCPQFVKGIYSGMGDFGNHPAVKRALACNAHIFCSNCPKGSQAVAFHLKPDGYCYVCLNSAVFKEGALSFMGEGLVIHELVHVVQMLDKGECACKAVKYGGNKPTFPTLLGWGDCKTCREREEPAYRQQAAFLYPAYQPNAKEFYDEFWAVGECISCGEICKLENRKDCPKFPPIHFPL